MDKHIFGFVLVLVVAVILLSGCSKSTNVTLSETEGNGNVQLMVGNQKGNLAPDFEAQLVDGGTFKLSNYRGEKPVLVYFWATWCPFCRRDLNIVKNVYPKYKDSVEFIAIDLDSSEDAETIRDYVNNNGLTDIKFALADTGILTDYSVTHTTEKYAISKGGIILWVGGGVVNENTWEIIFSGLKES